EEQIIGFAQEADDLLFGKTLLHVQSPWGRELDSKLRCYSKLGGRRSSKIFHPMECLSSIVPAPERN
ncbi:hypothetical protein, partial [Xanthomonas citri]|uniref:hypothetical protein n=1 Tax=Xanthomonas citri TaxID=346 RepID=UPI001CA5664A